MKSYLRFLGRNKLYTAIMAVGLSISLAFVIIMSCYVWQNLGVARRYYPDSERIMMVTGQTGVFKTSYRAMGKELLDNISEIEAATTLIYGSEMMAINNEEWLDTRLTMNVDSGFFDVFETEFIYGDKDVWDDVNNAIITRSMAERYGGEKVLGMPLFIAEYDHILTVAAVIDDFDKSIFQNCNIILNLDNPAIFGERPVKCSGKRELMGGVYTFIKIKDEMDAENICSGIKATHDRDYDPPVFKSFELISLDKIYLGGRSYSFSPRLKSCNPDLMKIFSAVVVILLFLAIFNYINLSTALTGQRSRELAGRMLAGEQRMEVLWKSVKEALAFVTACMVLAILLSIAVLPYINSLLNSPVPLEISFGERYIIIYLLIMLITGVLCSLVPSVISVRFKPIEVMKGRFRYESRKTFGKIFIIIQNSVAIIITAVALVMHCQMNHMMEMPFDVNMDNIYQCGVKSLSSKLGNDLEELPYVRKIGRSLGRPGAISTIDIIPLCGYDEVPAEDNVVPVAQIQCDISAFEIFGYQIVRRYGHRGTTGIWLTESCFNALKMDQENPVLPVRMRTYGLEFAGIIKDFALHTAIGGYNGNKVAVVYVYPDAALPYDIGDFILETEELTPQEKEELDGICFEAIRRLHGTDYVNAGYINDIMDAEYDEMKKQVAMVTIFMIIAIMLSALGQIAMSTYYATEREKEIGIRKVFGGTIRSESLRSLREYMVYCVIAGIIGVPVAVWICMKYLETFSYRMPDKPWIFIAATLIIFAISVFSVLWQTLRAARTNPAEALKKE